MDKNDHIWLTQMTILNYTSLWECTFLQPSWKTSCCSLLKLKRLISFHPNLPITETIPERNSCSCAPENMFRTAIVIITKAKQNKTKQSLPKCYGQENGYITRPVEYYTARTNSLQLHQCRWILEIQSWVRKVRLQKAVHHWKSFSSSKRSKIKQIVCKYIHLW